MVCGVCGSRGAPASLRPQGPLPRSSKREKLMNRSSRRGPRAPAGRRGAARLQREPSPAPRLPGQAVLSDLGVRLRPAGTLNCAITPAGRGSGSGPARARAGVAPRPRACSWSPEGQGLRVSLACISALPTPPRAWGCPGSCLQGEGTLNTAPQEGLPQKKQPLSQRERCIRVPLEGVPVTPRAGRGGGWIESLHQLNLWGSGGG